MKQIIAVSLIMALCACATGNNTSSKATDSKWVGRSVDELIVENGEPTDIYPAEGGGRVFEYFKTKNATASTQSSTNTQVLMPSGKPWVLPSDQETQARTGTTHPEWNENLPGRGITWRKRTGSISSDSALSNYCKMRFNISATDIIESLSIEGNSCD